MEITVSIHTKHLAFGDDGELFTFAMGDPDLGKFLQEWTEQESFDWAEVWVSD